MRRVQAVAVPAVLFYVVNIPVHFQIFRRTQCRDKLHIFITQNFILPNLRTVSEKCAYAQNYQRIQHKCRSRIAVFKVFRKTFVCFGETAKYIGMKTFCASSSLSAAYAVAVIIKLNIKIICSINLYTLITLANSFSNAFSIQVANGSYQLD